MNTDSEQQKGAKGTKMVGRRTRRYKVTNFDSRIDGLMQRGKRETLEDLLRLREMVVG